MRIALLGVDPESLTLAKAAAHAGHSIVWWSDAAAEIEPEFGPPAASDQYRDLFDSQVADAVIVGAGAEAEDQRVEQIKELAKAGQTLLLLHPATPSVLAYHEIDLSRGESQARIRVYNPLVASGWIAEFRRWVVEHDERLGPVEQIVAERRLVDRSRPKVLWHFARDVQLLAELAGRFNRLGSHGIDADDPAYGALSVQLTGPSRVPVRWLVAPADSNATLHVALIGQRGRVMARFDEHDSPVSCQLVVDGNATPLPVDAEDPAAAAIAKLAETRESDPPDSNFLAALEAMELTDTIEISLRRGRMIDVHHQQLTEQLAFKGTMSAIGCGTLLVLPPLLLVIGWLAGELGIPIARYWAHALAIALTLFVALQALPKLLLAKKEE